MEKRFNYLFRKYLNNTCTKEEFDEVFDFLKLPENDPMPGIVIRDVYDKEVRPKRTRNVSLSIAASILVLLIAGTSWILLTPGKMSRIQKTVVSASVIKKTERSEYKYIMLPDSTQVWLNAASSIEFKKQFDKNKREVVLKGEAYFDVKHADKIPFIIYTGKVSIVVMGTAFNIKAYPDLAKITVSVKRGKVRVNYSNQQVAMLIKGQEVSIATIGEIRQKKVKEEDTSAWQYGNLIYDDYSIGDIMTDLEKVYNVHIIVKDATVKNLHITTAFKREGGAGKALEVLCKLTDTKLAQENGTYIIK
jgi:transmembrane sensor